MTFDDLKTELYASGFAYLPNETGGSTRAGRWINQAYQELCDLEDWPFLETTVTGAAPLTITDLGRIVDIIDTTNKLTLVETDHAGLTTLVSDLTLTGNPAYYYLTGGSTVNVYPASTAAQLSVRYIKNPTDLSAAGDTPIVPTAFHDLIVLGAARRGMLDDNATADYQMIKQEWGERVGMMRTALLVTPERQMITWASGDW